MQITALRSPALGCQTKSQFFLPKALGRIAFLIRLLSISNSTRSPLEQHVPSRLAVGLQVALLALAFDVRIQITDRRLVGLEIRPAGQILPDSPDTPA